MCVIDWKTSHKQRPKLKDIHDYPLQTIAYAGAINDDKNYPFNVSIFMSTPAIQLAKIRDCCSCVATS